MVEGELKLDRCLIVVGDLGRPVADDLARLAGERAFDLAPCRDSYLAVAELASEPDRSTLVVGPIEELTRDSVFFTIAARNGARCCCLHASDRPSAGENVIAAVRAGATLAGSGNLAAVIDDWLSTERRSQAPSASEDMTGQDEEEYRTTQAELSALLGQEMDI
jgi:hypothetical protein